MSAPAARRATTTSAPSKRSAVLCRRADRMIGPSVFCAPTPRAHRRPAQRRPPYDTTWAAVGICRVVNAQALATEMASVKGEAAGRDITALRLRTAGSPCRWRGSGSDCAGRPAGPLRPVGPTALSLSADWRPTVATPGGQQRRCPSYYSLLHIAYGGAQIRPALRTGACSVGGKTVATSSALAAGWRVWAGPAIAAPAAAPRACRG